MTPAITTTRKRTVSSKLVDFAAYLNYMHVNLDDGTQSKIDECFSQIFDFIHQAIVPNSDKSSSDSFFTEESTDEHFPISNQTMQVDFKKQTTKFKELAGTEAEFYKIHKKVKELKLDKGQKG